MNNSTYDPPGRLPRLADPFYVHKVINSDERKRQLLSYAQKGATRQALTKQMLLDFEIVLPILPLCGASVSSLLCAFVSARSWQPIIINRGPQGPASCLRLMNGELAAPRAEPIGMAV